MSIREGWDRFDTWFTFWLVVVFLLWISGLVAPFYYFAPITFWQKIVFAGFEIFWAAISLAAGIITMIGVGSVVFDKDE